MKWAGGHGETGTDSSHSSIPSRKKRGGAEGNREKLDSPVHRSTIGYFRALVKSASTAACHNTFNGAYWPACNVYGSAQLATAGNEKSGAKRGAFRRGSGRGCRIARAIGLGLIRARPATTLPLSEPYKCLRAGTT